MLHDLTWMTDRPIAHRGYHNAEIDIYENTLSACSLAIEYGFNIEVDMHPAGNGQPIIFHDPTLERLSGDPRNVRELDPGQLAKVKIGNGKDTVATLDQLLELTDGNTGLVLEMKGVAGEDDGFVAAITNSLKNYHGPYVLMSFYHWLLKDARAIAPHIPLGLTALYGDEKYEMHKTIADECEVDFVSYKWSDLPCRFATEFRNSGKPVICWTTKSAEQMHKALQHCDQVTFEGFNPDNV